VVSWTALALIIWSFPVARPVIAGPSSKLVETFSTTGEAELYLYRLHACGTRSDGTSLGPILVPVWNGKVRGLECNTVCGRVRRIQSKRGNSEICNNS